MSFPPDPPVSPIADGRRASSGPAWNTVAAAVIGLLVVAYIVASIVQVMALRRGAADFTALGAATPGPASSELGATIDADLATIRHASVLSQITFWPMLIAFFGWIMILRNRARATGRGLGRQSTTALLVWRIGVFVSLGTILVVNVSSNPDTPDGLASEYQRLALYYVVRALVGGIYLWVVYSLWRSAGPLYAAGPARPVGYPMPPQVVYPPAPPGYYPPVEPGGVPTGGFTVPAPLYQTPPPQYGPPPLPGPAQPPAYPPPTRPTGEVTPS